MARYGGCWITDHISSFRIRRRECVTSCPPCRYGCRVHLAGVVVVAASIPDILAEPARLNIVAFVMAVESATGAVC
jgi:hypothetical protein